MRSRYSAFALGLDAYLLVSWNPLTRPETLDLDDGTVWRKLQIVDTVAGGPNDKTGVVEFRASYRDRDGSAGLLHERSNFSRVGGCWVYVNGQILG
jgi:SEC-C motif-containing protein